MKAWAKLLITLSFALNLGVLGGGLYRVLGQGEVDLDAREDLVTDRREGWEPGDWPHRRAALLGRRMDLSVEQREHLRRELGGLQPQVQAAGRELLEQRRRFRELLLEDRPDAVHVHAQQARVSKLQSHMDSLVAEVLLREASILHPDQRRHHDRHWPGGRLHHGRRGGGGGHHGMRR